ncbi:MAG: metallophosphoesterase family protein [Eubacterium sp.]|nr:metallophosphoesterase family protein [Eubacterium sp.]
MKFGIITDIHNNLPALKAVTERLNKLECDKIICCGDIIGIGPCPEETVQYMMQIPNLIAVRGNHEKYLLEGMPNEYPNDENMSFEEMKHHKWEHSLLSAESISFLNGLPYKMEFICEGFKISVMHYCMDREGHYVNNKANSSEDDLKKMFSDVTSDIILYGHDHNRNICKGDRLYINIGSLGCPAQDKNIARGGILNIEQSKVDIQPIDVKYDVDNVIDLIDHINYPDADNIKKFFYGIW